MTETARLPAQFRSTSGSSGGRSSRQLQTAEEGGSRRRRRRRAPRPLVPVVPHLRRLGRTTALVGLSVVLLPVFAAGTREGWGVLATLVLPLPVAASTALLCAPLLRRVVVPRRDRPLRMLPPGRVVSPHLRPRWGGLLQAATVVTVAGLLGVGALLEGPGADFGLLVNAYVVGGALVGAAVGVLRAAARLAQFERRHRVQVVTSAGLRGSTWARPRRVAEPGTRTPSAEAAGGRHSKIEWESSEP